MRIKKTVTLRLDKNQHIDLLLEYKDITETKRLAFATFCDSSESRSSNLYSKRTGWNKPFKVLNAVGDEIWKFLLEVRKVDAIYFPVVDTESTETLMAVANRFLERRGYIGLVLKDEGGFEIRFDVLKSVISD